MKNDWTVRVLLIILMGSLSLSCFAGNASGGKRLTSRKEARKMDLARDEDAEERVAKLEARLRMLNEELAILRRALSNALDEAEKREKKLTRIQASVAASLADGRKRSVSEESRKLLESLSEVEKIGGELVAAAVEFCDFVEVLLDKNSVTELDRARMKFRIGKLKSVAELFHAKIKNPPEREVVKSCRILTLNDKLQLAVLNAGSANGVRNGLILKTVGAKKTVLRVVDVRPYISGAIVIEGVVDSLAPGMRLCPGK